MAKKRSFIPAFLALFLLFTPAAFSNVGLLNNKDSAKTGVNFTDFVLGMKDSAIYKLSDLAGGRFIVLAFLDSSLESLRLKKLIAGAVNKISAAKPGLLWFNINRDKEHVEIYEATSLLKLRYRTLFSNIPKTYSFPSWPAILIIDPRGIIQFIYVGYSPTCLEDVENWLKGAK